MNNKHIAHVFAFVSLAVPAIALGAVAYSQQPSGSAVYPMDPPVVAHVEIEDITPAPLPEIARPKPVAKKTAPVKEQASCKIQTLKAAGGFGERRVRVCDVPRSPSNTARVGRLAIALHTPDLTGLLTSN
jgi:hypothetical protein